MYKIKKSGFTLAEVLITLLIIGVVASLVIPGLINNTNKAEYVAKLKKEYAVLQQAFNLLVIDAGGSILNNPNFNSATGDSPTRANAMNEFATKLNVIKNCGNNLGCWYTTPRKYLGGSINVPNVDLDYTGDYGKAILADGTIMLVGIYSSNCTTNRGAAGSPTYGSVCGSVDIDINGASGPNQIGRDYFLFWIAKTGIYPAGTYSDGRTCDLNSNTWNTSAGCAGKILSEGAMNY